jgi:hypothetical protein
MTKAHSQELRADLRWMLSKVPEITLYFWVIKVLCTTVGETASDNLTRRSRAQAIVGGHAQLDERDEPPTRAAPLLVRMPTEASVALLAAQEPAHERSREELVRVRGHVLAENVAPRQEPNRRLPRCEQEVDRRLRRRVSFRHRHEEMFGVPRAPVNSQADG